MFDLGDATKWEFFFPNVEQPLLVVNEDSSVTSREEKQVLLSWELVHLLTHSLTHVYKGSR